MANWIPVPEFEDLYLISDQGQLKRIATRMGDPCDKTIKPHLKRHGYADYWLWRHAKKKRFGCHRLVWLSFNGPIPDGLELNHMNGDKLDNRLCNLELVTRSENTIHKFRVLGYPSPNYPSPGIKNGSAVLTDEKVREIRRRYELGTKTQYDIAAEFGVCQRTINQIVRRLTWRHVA